MFRHSVIATILRVAPPRRRSSLASSFCSSLQNDKDNIVVVSSAEPETVLIKPSSPTPRHLTKFKLSLLDLYFPPIYTPFIFFYPPAPAGRLDVLKSSLAHALTRFYPLAGRLMSKADDDSVPFIHCNDEGVPFSVAAAGIPLDSFLGRSPQIESLHQFLPFRQPFLIGADFPPQIAVRATVFPCGGIAVGIFFSHRFMDAHSLIDFMKLWAAIAAGGNEMVGGGAYAHDRAAASLFPARDGDVIPPEDHYLTKGGKRSTTRRFVFDEEAISSLKVRASSESVPKPTRSEAVFGLVWSSAVHATARALSADGAKLQTSVLSIAVMAADLRPRMKERWPDYSVGNILLDLICSYDTDQEPNILLDETKRLQVFVQKMRSSIAKLDEELVSKLEGGGGREELLKYEEVMCKMVEGAAQRGTKVMPFTMSSVVGMGFYDVDFGWGKPTWISMTEFPDLYTNIVILMNSPIGYGVEAWVSLPEEEMGILERDPLILAYAKKNP